MIGRTEDANAMFARLLDLRNELGLLSEEYDPVLQRQVGNFPQAFSHVSLVNSACRLTGQDELMTEESERRLRHRVTTTARQVGSGLRRGSPFAWTAALHPHDGVSTEDLVLRSTRRPE
jgi:hypothetical protein